MEEGGCSGCPGKGSTGDLGALGWAYGGNELGGAVRWPEVLQGEGVLVRLKLLFLQAQILAHQCKCKQNFPDIQVLK